MLPRMLINSMCRILPVCITPKVSPACSRIISSTQARSLLQTIFIPDKFKHTSTRLSEKLDLLCAEKHSSGLNQVKSKLIMQMNFKSDEDAVPFYALPIKTLVHVYKVIKADEGKGYCKNRLYFLSEKIQHPSSVVSVHLAQRIFVYSLSFHWLQQSLELLLEMGVSGDRILRDLWVLKYHHETIRQRLQRIKDTGVDNFYPWMIRCSEDILNRYIEIYQETKNILGDGKSTQMYLADRLNTTPEAVKDMCLKIPALKTIRVTKVKHFLDFLLSEGFQVEDIANKPRVITASKKTVKQRLDKLRSLGITEINLNVLCRSKKDFKKYCDSVTSVVGTNDTR